jgi:hypothetical protein
MRRTAAEGRSRGGPELDLELAGRRRRGRQRRGRRSFTSRRGEQPLTCWCLRGRRLSSPAAEWRVRRARPQEEGRRAAPSPPWTASPSLKKRKAEDSRRHRRGVAAGRPSEPQGGRAELLRLPRARAGGAPGDTVWGSCSTGPGEEQRRRPCGEEEWQIELVAQVEEEAAGRAPPDPRGEAQEESSTVHHRRGRGVYGRGCAGGGSKSHWRRGRWGRENGRKGEGLG